MEIVLRTFATEVMTTGRSNSLLCSLIADAADEDILTTFAILLQDQIRMICDLAHLHNETKNICIVVQDNTLSNVGFELTGTAVHNATSEVILFLPKELTINVDFLGGEFHRR